MEHKARGCKEVTSPASLSLGTSFANQIFFAFLKFIKFIDILSESEAGREST